MKNILRIRRESCGGRLREVAELVGVNVVRVHRWECGVLRPSVEERVAWEDAVRRLEERSRVRVVRG